MSQDTFIRANAASISTGAPWTYVPSFQEVGAPEILSNKAHQIDIVGNGTVEVANSDMGSADHLVSIRIGTFTPSGTTSVSCGPAVRCNNTGANGGSGYWTTLDIAAGPVYTLYQLCYVTGIFSAVVASVSLTSIFGGTFVPVAGDIIGLRAAGSTFTSYYNGTSVLTGSSATLATGNYGGFGMSRSSSGVDVAVDLLYLNEDPIVTTTFIPRASTGVLL